jgi:hypothetical protein
LYAVRSQHPLPRDAPTNITAQVQLAMTDLRALDAVAA